MSDLAHMLSPLLPFLRRYARSLTGSQQNGDAIVAHVLEQLVADPTQFPRDIDPRIALYRAFTRLWNSADGTCDSSDGNIVPFKTLVDRRIEMLTPVSRQAFLLVAVEGFTPAEAATILGKSEAALARDLETASTEIAKQVATSVLIIEDETLIALDLEDIARSLGHDIIAIAGTKTQALGAFSQHRPGLILADVQLADGSSGIEAVREILGGMEVPVIFVTAYPEAVLTGLKSEPTFVIPKPFEPNTLRIIISQALFFDLRARRSHAA
jgi:DNA-directed RNA polymerase specialized sigma24 family protein